MYPDKWDKDGFVEHLLSTLMGTHYRAVQGTWWVFNDGFWVATWSTRRINEQIVTEMEEVGWDEGMKGYIVDRVRQQLKAELNTDRLPGSAYPGPP